MKKIIVFLLLFTSIGAIAQIEMKPDTVLTQVGSMWKVVKVYNIYVVQSIPIASDSVIYSIGTVPNSIYQNGVINEYHEIIGDTLYKYTNQAKADITYSRRIILWQRVNKYIYKAVERTPDEKMLFYLKKGKELNIKNSTFYNYQPIQDIINPTPVTNDSIQ